MLARRALPQVICNEPSTARRPRRPGHAVSRRRVAPQIVERTAREIVDAETSLRWHRLPVSFRVERGGIVYADLDDAEDVHTCDVCSSLARSVVNELPLRNSTAMHARVRIQQIVESARDAHTRYLQYESSVTRRSWCL